MPNFEFTSPDGKSYTVEGPEGATKEQAFEMLQKQLSAGGDKPAAGAAKPSSQSPQMAEGQGAQPDPNARQAQPKATIGEAAKEVAKNTGIGAAIGAVAPELTMGAGIAVGMVPGLQGVGAAIFTGGEMMRGARIASAVLGAGQAAMSSTAGQVAKASGATKGEQTGIELATGLVGPAVASKAIELGSFVATPLKAAWKLATNYVAGDVAAGPKAVEAARNKLAAPGTTSQPQIDFHATLKQGVEADLKAADAAAKQTMDAAKQHADAIAGTDSAAATRLMDDARTRAGKIQSDARERARVLDEATNGKLKTAAAVQKAANHHLQQVGTPREASDIGADIRKAVVGKQGEEKAARDAAYKQQVAERDQTIAAKEAKGETIDKLPEMKQLKKEIDTLTLDTKVGQKAAGGLAKVTDPGSLTDLRKVREAVNNRRVQTGVDDAGNPTYQTFPTTFAALDDVRRKLGDALKGQAKEGYAAIGQQRARELYAKLSDIQGKYVGGEVQKQIQREYAEATGDLARYKVGRGKTSTATERLAPDTFVKDPATLPGQFFKTRQSYADLKSLTGNDQLAQKLASDHTAKSLQGMDSKQARAWWGKNQDWLRDEPGLNMQTDTYIRKLAQTERIGDKLGQRANALQSEKSKALGEGEKQSAAEIEGATARAKQVSEGSVDTQARVLKEGEKAAAEVRKTAQAKAEGVMKQGYPAEATRKLLTTGTPEEVRYATQYISGTPGGKKVIEQSVRGILRDSNPRNIEQLWQERVRPLLKDGQVIPNDRIIQLDKQIQAVVDATRGGKPKPGAIAQLVRAALTTSLSTAGGHATAYQTESEKG